MGKLTPGDKAPDFALLDADGKTVRLKDLLGHRPGIVVYFYPRDDTPGCTKEACQFTDNMAGFEGLGVPVVGISPDSTASHVKFRDKYKLGITLLSDPSKETMEAYGAFGEKTMYGKTVTGVIRSTFLIDEKGKIAKAWYNVKADGHAAKVLAELT
jgi:peroxiredoxin Q/BCP